MFRGGSGIHESLCAVGGCAGFLDGEGFQQPFIPKEFFASQNVKFEGISSFHFSLSDAKVNLI